MYLLYSGMGVGVLSGSAVVDTQLGGYQVVFVKSPHKKEFVNRVGCFQGDRTQNPSFDFVESPKSYIRPWMET